MRSRWMGVAVLMTLFAGVSMAVRAGEPNRLAALAARQTLCDQVHIAMADGHISPGERYALFVHAKAILKPDEYQSFKKAVDRLSPPKTLTVQRSVKVVQRKVLSAASTQAPPLAQPSLALTIPAGVALPDGMASPGGAR